jgi:hypothetical protein
MRTSIALLLFSITLSAQQTPLSPPPAVLQLNREFIRPGRRADVMEIERQSVRSQAELKSPHWYLALTSMSGRDDLWWVHGFDSFAAIDQEWVKVGTVPGLMQQWSRTPKLKADMVSDSLEIYAHFRDDLSYGGGLTGNRTRYLIVTTVTVLPGHGGDFAELRRQIRAGHERARAGDNIAVYQVDSGMPDGSYLMFTFTASLDEAGTVMQFRSRLQERAASDNLAVLAAKSIQQSQTAVFAVNPEISYPAPEWIQSDPEFWSANVKAKP